MHICLQHEEFSIEIPENARKFVKRMSELIGCPVTTVGVGPDLSLIHIWTMKRSAPWT